MQRLDSDVIFKLSYTVMYKIRIAYKAILLTLPWKRREAPLTFAVWC